nr:hypothetical protein [Sulfurivirga caldicuralii]
MTALVVLLDVSLLHKTARIPRPDAFATRPRWLEALETAPWARKVMQHWQVGETAAQTQLIDFLERRLTDYPDKRDIPAEDATSRLSPALHFGHMARASSSSASSTAICSTTFPIWRMRHISRPIAHFHGDAMPRRRPTTALAGNGD